jgi:DNA-binding MarR family transcriptional regulator
MFRPEQESLMARQSTIFPWSSKPAAKPSGQAAPAAVPDSISSFANLIAGMSRFLNGIAQIPLFKSGEHGLTEWVALYVLSENDGISNNQLAHKLGVTGQRINQVTTSLARGGLITVTQSQADSRKNELRLAPAGRDYLTAVEQQLKPLITAGFGDREAVLSRMSKQTRFLSRIVAAAKSAAPANDK